VQEINKKIKFSGKSNIVFNKYSKPISNVIESEVTVSSSKTSKIRQFLQWLSDKNNIYFNKIAF